MKLASSFKEGLETLHNFLSRFYFTFIFRFEDIL